MSKLVLTLIASLFAVSAFALDAAPVHTATPVAAPAAVTASAPKKVSKVKHNKSPKGTKAATAPVAASSAAK